ncbi:HEPN domain-containing protein [Microvirga brassicacearum]|uniref:HEPN domain-containing protein n=1 Tax=Microvirga brassicacearum TaxID=2580413 RepID=UPI001391F1B4
MQHAIESRERKLDAFFARAMSAGNDELKSDLARFGAVLVCGYVERCVEVIILHRLTTRAQPRVLLFIRSHFKKGTNYDCEAICQLLIRFDQNWETAFRSTISRNDQWSSSLASAYALRNSIAHGGDGNKGLPGVEALYTDCKNIVVALVEATNN